MARDSSLAARGGPTQESQPAVGTAQPRTVPVTYSVTAFKVIPSRIGESGKPAESQKAAPLRARGARKSVRQKKEAIANRPTPAAILSQDHVSKSPGVTQAGGWMFSFFITLPHLNRLSMQASSDASDVVRQATRVGIFLIVLLLVGSVIASLVYRLIARRWLDERAKKPLAPSREQTADGEHHGDHEPESRAVKPSPNSQTGANTP